jgi:hypothetical protein
LKICPLATGPLEKSETPFVEKSSLGFKYDKTGLLLGDKNIFLLSE